MVRVGVYLYEGLFETGIHDLFGTQTKSESFPVHDSPFKGAKLVLPQNLEKAIQEKYEKHDGKNAEIIHLLLL